MWIIQAKYDSPDFYSSLENELSSLVAGEKNLYANLANISSWIYHSIPDLNWAGFYLWSNLDNELILGPFQGKPACIRIKPERGVCGAAYSQKRTIRIDDVHSFPDHITCDSASQSELVIPLEIDDQVKALLDLDSPTKRRFSELDEKELTRIFKNISKQLF
jgi:L-methionine (R)-S-oxide reductase